MGTAKLYFEEGIPEASVVKKWTEEFGCFHTPEVVISTNTENKIMIVDFDESHYGMCSSWESFFNASGAKWISFFARDEIGEGDSYYILHSDRENIFSMKSSKKDFLNKTLLGRCKFLKSVGFNYEYRRFFYSGINDADRKIVLDCRIPDTYFIELFGEEEAKKMGIFTK